MVQSRAEERVSDGKTFFFIGVAALLGLFAVPHDVLPVANAAVMLAVLTGLLLRNSGKTVLERTNEVVA